MSAFPYLPLFTDVWISNTKHLSRLERGTYLDLLVLMWLTPECRVPNDDAWLARRLLMTADEVKTELRPLIAEFCQTDGNWLTQKRLLKEFNGAKKVTRQRSAAAKSLWAKKKGIGSADAEKSNPAYDPTLPYPTPVESKKDSPPAPQRGEKRPKPKTVLPNDWAISTADAAFAAERGFQGQRVRTMVERFINHHRAKRTTSGDWAASWRTWVLNQVEFDARDRRGGLPAVRPGGGPRNGGPSFFDIAQGNFGQEATDGE